LAEVRVQATSKQWELGLIVSLTLVAAALRLLWLDTVPPGWHYDEAKMGLLASEVYRNLGRPLFFTAWGGQEPLYIYLSAGVMWLLGGNQDTFPLRLTAATFGIATVPATYLLGRELFGRRAGLLASALTAVSFYHIMLSRQGYRFTAEGFLQALAVYLASVAIRRRSVVYSIFAGAVTGGVVYTYLAGRAFPVVFSLFALWWLIFRAPPDRKTRGSVLAFTVAAVAVVAPLLGFFWTHPGTFFARMESASAFRPGASIAEMMRIISANLAKLVAAILYYGDTLERWNIAGRPILLPPFAILFGVGLLAALRGLFHREAVHALLTSWLAVMVLPCILSWDSGAYTPRSMGLVPLIYLLPAVGFVSLWDWAIARIPYLYRGTGRLIFAGLAIGLLLTDGIITTRDYFFVWPTSYGAEFESCDDMAKAARYMEREARPAEESLFVASDYPQHTTVAHLAPHTYPYARWFDARSALVLPETSGQGSLYLFPSRASADKMLAYLPSGACSVQATYTNGLPELTVCRLGPGQVRETAYHLSTDPSFTAVQQRFGDVIQLLAYKEEGHQVEAGGKLHLTTLWRILQDAPRQDYAIFVHLLDHRQQLAAQRDSSAFPATEWRRGDLLVTRYEIPLDRNLLPGVYTLVMGVYDRGSRQRLPVQQQVPASTTVPLGSVVVTTTGEQSKPEHILANQLGDSIHLVGYDLEPDSPLKAAGTLRVRLHWRAAATPKEDYTVFVQLLSADGHLVAQSDSQPADGRFPTSYWPPDVTVTDEHVLKLDGSLPSGRYTLIAGMYLLSTGQRLPVEGRGDYLRLAEIDLER